MTKRAQFAGFGQRGATAVEFAFVAMILVVLLLGILQLGFIMYRFNSAAEATRFGARIAVVSAVDADPLEASGPIFTGMQSMLPDLTPANVVIEYVPGTGVEYVAVSLAGAGDSGKTPYRVTPWFFWLAGEQALAVPPFRTALSREGLGLD